MALKRYNSTTVVGPVGVVDSGALRRAGALQTQGLSEAAGQIRGMAEESLTLQRTLEAQDAAAKTRVQRDPLTGRPVIPEANDTYSVFGKEYRKAVTTKYGITVQSDVRQTMGDLALANHDNPAKFLSEANAYLQETVEQVHPSVQGSILESGSSLVSQYSTKIASEKARLAIADAQDASAMEMKRQALELDGLRPGSVEYAATLSRVMEQASNMQGFTLPGEQSKLRYSLVTQSVLNWAVSEVGKISDPVQQAEAIQQFAKGKGPLWSAPDGFEMSAADRITLASGALRTLATEQRSIDALKKTAKTSAVMTGLLRFFLADGTDLPPGVDPLDVADGDPSVGLRILAMMKARQDEVKSDASSDATNAMLITMSQALADAYGITLPETSPAMDSTGVARVLAATISNALSQRARNEQEGGKKSDDAMRVVTMGMFETTARENGFDISVPAEWAAEYAKMNLADKAKVKYALLKKAIKDDGRIKEQTFLENFVNQMAETNPGIREYMKNLEKQNMSTNQIITLGKNQVSLDNARVTEAARQARLSAPVIDAINGKPGEHSDKNALAANNVFQMRYDFEQARAQPPGAPGLESQPIDWAGDWVTGLAARAGIIPEKTVTIMRAAMSGDADASRAGYDVYIKLSATRMGRFALSAAIKPELQAAFETAKAMNGSADAFDNFGTRVYPPDWGKVTGNTDQERQAALNKTFDAVWSSEMRNGPQKDGGLASFLYRNLIHVPGFMDGPNEIRLPEPFRTAVKQHFLRFAAINDAADEGEREQSILNSMQAVAQSGKWGVSTLSPHVATKGGVFVQYPPEEDLKDIEGNSAWANEVVSRLVNDNADHTHLKDGTRFTAGENVFLTRFSSEPGMPLRFGVVYRDKANQVRRAIDKDGKPMVLDMTRWKAFENMATDLRSREARENQTAEQEAEVKRLREVIEIAHTYGEMNKQAMGPGRDEAKARLARFEAWVAAVGEDIASFKAPDFYKAAGSVVDQIIDVMPLTSEAQ